MQFRNFYRRGRCNHMWTDVWSATCDDNCPHCGALASQTWYGAYADRLKEGSAPYIPGPEFIDKVLNDLEIPTEVKDQWVEHTRKINNGNVFLRRNRIIAHFTASYKL